jgi:SecD/SecF fusion protein
MIENLGRRIALIIALLVIAVLVLVLPSKPIRLGLDLAGGVRLVYRLDFDQAKANGQITGNEDKNQLVEESIAIIRTRVDPDGLREPIIRKLGTDRIEIQLPGSAEVTGEVARAKLASPIAGSGDETALRATIGLGVATPKELEAFPATGGVIRVGAERIRYTSRVGNQLFGIERGKNKTAIAAHDAGGDVELASDDQIQNAIENLGDLRFYVKAKPGDFLALNTTEEAERKKVTDWIAKPENVASSIKVFNALAPEAGGPAGRVRWFPMRQEEGQAFVPREQRLVSLVEPPDEWTFTGDHMSRVQVTADQTGFPAVSFELVDAKKNAFLAFTTKHVDEGMAIVLNDEIVSLATINEPLPGSAQISGRFTDRYASGLVTVLRSGSLKIKPVLEQREDVGATVGQEYVDQGWIMGLTALGVIVLFMCTYYRELGVIASIGLVYNLVLQMGALAGFQATLTMPGIAGIILGIGMAVDANILIFDRIREEQDAGKKPMQAVKAGFEGAFSAIFDSNVTTVLAGAILAYIGTGPIRGFAVTLIIGVLTSMFSALVVARVLVQRRLKKNPDQPFKMGRLLAHVNYDVVGKTRLAIGISAVLIVAGLSLFFWLDNQRKFGIDFLGGGTAKVRTERPVAKEEIESRIRQIPGDIGASAEVAALPRSRAGDDTYTEFRVTFKANPDSSAEGGSSEDTFKSEIRAGLGDLLQREPIQVTADAGTDGTNVLGDLYFEDTHTGADIAARLGAARFTEAQGTPHADRPNVVAITAKGPSGMSAADARAAIKAVFTNVKDSAGRDFKLADPIPETSVIGRRVVGELRDSALKALLLSMLVTIIYIRVRFAEYTWGFAAVASLVHDIFFTVGAIAFLVWVPFIHVEFDMGTIAVFLTIVGYSINDTIIVFDRIRENLPRVKGSMSEIVNLSINQTFSRTIMTSGTTVATIMVVLLFNLGTGNVLEGFAFTMTFGIVTGTFSSIYIASPILIWLEARHKAKQEAAAKLPKPPAVQSAS